jgi:endonuclease-3
MELKPRKARARKVIAGLKQVFPDATCALNFETPLDLTVATILSAQCTDERVNMVTKDLFKKYRSAQDYASALPGVLEEEIHPTGFFRQKSISLRGMGQKLVEQFQGQVPKTMEEMTQLPGVARKTANVVLGTAYGIPSGIVVDTHVHRLSFRMGLSDEKDPVKIERDLMEAVPRREWIWFGHAMILHGRQTCIARTPRCSACVLRDFCPKRGVSAAIAALASRRTSRAAAITSA